MSHQALSRLLNLVVLTSTNSFYSIAKDSIAFLQARTSSRICVNAHMWVYACLPCVSPSLVFLKRWSPKQTHTQQTQTQGEECEVEMHVENACVNFLWQQKEASVCTAFNNELKGNSGHVTQIKAEMPSDFSSITVFTRFIWHC